MDIRGIRHRIASWFRRPAPGGEQRWFQPGDPYWAKAGALLGLNDRLTDPYQQHAFVFACVRAIATAIAGVPFRLYRGRGEKATPLDDTEVLAQRLARPNVYGSAYLLWVATATYLKLYGNAMWMLKRENAKQIPEEILVFPNDGWGCELDRDNRITHYTFDQHNGKAPIVVPPERVIHFRKFSHRSPIWGMGELEAARLSAEQDYSASLYNRSFFQNSAIPGGIIEYPSGATPLNPKQWEAIKERWQSMHQGVLSAFKLAALEGGAKFTALSLPHRDMMFLQQRQYNRAEICAVFGVPPSKIGVFDDVQKAVQESVERGFWSDTLIPEIGLLQDAMYSQFFLPLDEGRTWGKFDLSGVPVLQKPKADLLLQAKTMFDMAFSKRKINDYLGMDWDLDDVEDADVGYISPMLMPIGSEPEAEPTPEPEPEDEDEDEKAAPRAKADLVTNALPHTPEQLAAADNFVRIVGPPERAMCESVRGYLNSIKAWLKEQLADATTIADIPQDALELSDKWDTALQKIASKHYARVAAAMKPVIEQHLAKVGIDFTVELTDKRIVQFLKGKEIKVVGINNTIRQGIREKLVSASESGAGVSELQEEIYKVLQDTRARALRIARTETASAANGVEYTANSIAGVTKQMWIAARDEHTRPSHLACMAQGAVDLGKAFVNGCRFPGDPQGDPGEIVNCRCSLMPVE